MPTLFHLIESWGPGGAETIFAELASSMRDRGWKSLPAVPKEGWLSRELRDRGLRPIFTGTDESRGWDVLYLTRLVRFLRRNEVDLVQTHLFGSALYGGVAAELAGIPAVATLHGDWDLREATGYRRVKIPVVDRVCERRVFVSEPLRHSCVNEFGMKKDGAVVIENGIDTDRFRPRQHDDFRHELNVSQDEFLVGAIGNVRPAKNHGMLFRVAAELVADDVGVHVALVGEGEGEEIERLRRERRELDLDGRVHFVGFREDVDDVLNSVDAYVLTSDSEGFSLTTVQAMACGVPVVATRCGGPEVLIEDGATGFLVERRDAGAMASVLRELAADSKLRERIGNSARQEVERRYSIDRMVDSYEGLYRGALAGDR